MTPDFLLPTGLIFNAKDAFVNCNRATFTHSGRSLKKPK
jgi:hypothetical protein